MEGASCTIAIVDDDRPVLKSLGRLLRGRGFQVTAFESAERFLATVADERPDCLLLDLQMPGMTGFELMEELSNRRIEVPVIVITAHGDAQLAERCTASGAVACLPKPLQPALLLAAVDAACRPPKSDTSSQRIRG